MRGDRRKQLDRERVHGQVSALQFLDDLPVTTRICLDEGLSERGSVGDRLVGSRQLARLRIQFRMQVEIDFRRHLAHARTFCHIRMARSHEPRHGIPDRAFENALLQACQPRIRL